MKAWSQWTDEIHHEPLWDADLRLSMGSPGTFPRVSAYYLSNPFMKVRSKPEENVYTVDMLHEKGNNSFRKIFKEILDKNYLRLENYMLVQIQHSQEKFSRGSHASHSPLSIKV